MKTKTYRVGAQGAYRQGVLYAPGSHISLPDDDRPENLPSDTWTPVALQETKDGESKPLPTGPHDKTVGELKKEKGGGKHPAPASAGAPVDAKTK